MNAVAAGFRLLEAAGESMPESAVVARLPGQGFTQVELADLAYFTALRSVHCSAVC